MQFEIPAYVLPRYALMEVPRGQGGYQILEVDEELAGDGEGEVDNDARVQEV